METTSPILGICSTADKGLGVVVKVTIPRDTVVLRFDGPSLEVADISDFTHVIQSGPKSFIGPSGAIDDYVNHSCDPNTGLRTSPNGQLELFALRTLRPGTEVTFDYSTCLDYETAWSTCLCGSPKCRGSVVPFRDLSPCLQRRYLRRGAVPQYLSRDLQVRRAISGTPRCEAGCETCARSERKRAARLDATASTSTTAAN